MIAMGGMVLIAGAIILVVEVSDRLYVWVRDRRRGHH